MKKIFLILALIVSFKASATIPEYLNGLPTTAQELTFTVKEINNLITPMGYELVFESVSISELLAYPGAHRPVRIQNSEYCYRSVFFTVIELKTKKKLSGSTYLIVVNKNVNPSLLNSTYKKFQVSDLYRQVDEFFGLILAKELSPSSFGFDLSPLDLKLR